MPLFYCHYCDANLPHGSARGRAEHNTGRKHVQNKIDYWNRMRILLLLFFRFIK